jgi:hypothetical protein
MSPGIIPSSSAIGRPDCWVLDMRGKYIIFLVISVCGEGVSPDRSVFRLLGGMGMRSSQQISNSERGQHCKLPLTRIVFYTGECMEVAAIKSTSYDVFPGRISITACPRARRCLVLAKALECNDSWPLPPYYRTFMQISHSLYLSLVDSSALRLGMNEQYSLDGTVIAFSQRI